MKNKKLVLVAVLVLLLAIVLVWCSNSQPSTTSTEAATVPTVETTQPKDEGNELIDADELRPTAENQEKDDAPAKETQPDEPTLPEEETTPDETNPEETKPAETKPTEPAAGTSCGCEYEQYLSMSASEQEAYMNSFPSPLDFINWCQNAEAAHAGHNTVTNVTGGDLDISNFVGG